MKLSNTSEYALRILCFMAKDENRLYSAKYLIDELKISDKYLRRLMTDLTKSGFITSIQGRDGGYKFQKSSGEIFLADVINSVEGMDKYTGCALGFCECNDKNPCVMHDTWVPVRSEFMKAFTKKTIKDLNIMTVSKY
ncbi:MAG: Rrf2 family transcriptional regulator [Paludibacter sp.]|nr:Rrf2 family transcriptional regulator [Paludibacter sp.]